MRSWLIYLTLIALMVPLSSGCTSFRRTLSNISVPGLKPNRSVDPDEILDPLGARDSNRLLLDDLSPSQFATTLKTRTSGPDQAAAERYYAQGQQQYNQGIAQLDAEPTGEAHKETFAQAANSFRLAAASWPDSQIEEDSNYFEGEAYFFADRYVQSNRAFEKLVANYSGSKYLDLAQNRRYAIAIYWLQLSENGAAISFNDSKRPTMKLAAEARRVLHRIRIDDPTGKLADDATIALGQAFMQAQSYYEAADTFEDLRRNYPGSKHQFKAHMLELQARLEGYQGPSYDGTPLKKADEILTTIVKQFPKQAEEELPYIKKQATLIRNQIAERDYRTGQYFESRGENLAAKMSYDKVAKQFQDTELAKTIQQRIAEVAKKPPKPEQHAQWLVDLFPNPADEKPVILAGNNESNLKR